AGDASRQSALQEQFALQNQPINLVNAIRGGSQITNRTFGNFAQAGKSQTPDLMGAGQAQYQGALNSYNSQPDIMGGLFGLGGTILGGPTGSLGGMLGGKIGGILGF
ncbi:hypothetical protein QMK98_29875, partial [Klebsiella pneumoniae]|uniref:hypothetical protein n=1 Tax=Klebsiella pneumoniae TaxID=573 RepID=UPI003A898B00